MHHIYYIMGKSASGKDTLYKRLYEKRELKLNKIVLYTTRPIRENETNGDNYNFVSEEDFRRFLQSGKVIESRTYNVVGGVWTYFTMDDGSVDIINKDYIIIGTLESYEKMREYYKGDIIVPIYIEVDNRVRLKRAIEREDLEVTPRYAEVCRRFLADEKDFSDENLKKNNINKKFINDDLEKCFTEIVKYIQEIKIND